ncbi:MAG: EAL domain-containing protein [Clostridia bacterium]
MSSKSKRYIITAVFLVLIFVTISVFYSRYVTVLLTTESQMHLSEVATQGAASVQRQVARDFDMLEILADGQISDPMVPLEKKMERIKKQADNFGLFRIGIVDLNGNAITSDGHEFSVADREFFNGAVKGERFLSQPIIDKVDGVTPGIVYAVPVFNDNKVVSVLFSGYELAKLTDRIDISFYHDSGLAFIADSSGNILLHPNKDRINKNLVDVANLHNSKEEVSEFQQGLTNRTSGVSHFIMNSEDRFFAYSPIKGANDWFLVTSLPAKSVFERSEKVIMLSILLMVILSIVFTLIVLYIIITKKNTNDKILKLAYYDALTGIPNIEQFKLTATTLFKENLATSYSILNFDIKQFRFLNNDLGYKVGNEFLIFIANRLKNFSTTGETFARVSADQFLLLFYNKHDNAVLEKYIYNLKSEIATWNQALGSYYSAHMAFGVYKIESVDTDIMTAIEKSNIARKSAKESYDSDIAIYNIDIQKEIDFKKELVKSMPLALKNGEFKLFIQPKYDFTTEKIVGGEALVRWIKPDGTMIMPNEFISLFEQTGDIYSLDMFMLDTLCKFIKNLISKNITAVPISINQSRNYMYRQNYVESIFNIVKENNVTTSLIELEITENTVYTNLDSLIEVLDKLQSLGFKLSLDDFGSGYSSLNVLKNLSVDTIKLDRFMLSETLTSDREKTVVSNIINMAKELNISVVAEGVETIEQVDFLRKCGCETAQGYYYSKPIPAKDFEKLLLN